MFTNIIVGLDGREESQAAIRLATSLAAPSAEITLANVSTWATHPGIGASSCRQRSLELLSRERDIAGIDADLVCGRARSVGPGLHKLCREAAADLLVVGCSHRGTLGRLLIGDDARSALRASPCPVAIASRSWKAPRRPLRVGVGYDGSAESDLALSIARAVQSATGTELTARFVLPLQELPYGERPTSQAAKTAARVSRRRRGDLDTLYGIDATSVCGNPVKELAQYSRRLDLLILGTRGLSAPDRVLLGSTTDRLSSLVHCAMLVIPSDAERRHGEPQPF
ncbi:MAG: universal stress protein, partial [Solirubrobacteraceae bacterium]